MPPCLQNNFYMDKLRWHHQLFDVKWEGCRIINFQFHRHQIPQFLIALINTISASHFRLKVRSFLAINLNWITRHLHRPTHSHFPSHFDLLRSDDKPLNDLMYNQFRLLWRCVHNAVQTSLDWILQPNHPTLLHGINRWKYNEIYCIWLSKNSSRRWTSLSSEIKYLFIIISNLAFAVFWLQQTEIVANYTKETVQWHGF